jgi:nucleotide-binding universal stress UspA family protein
MIRQVLVAVDGSDGSKRAARFARELAAALQARVTLLHVIELPASLPLEAYGLTRTQVYEGQLEAAGDLLGALAAEMPAGMVEQVIESGSPAETICAQAEERSADLVILGSRGMGAVGRWLLGSVSDRVVHLCKRPVTIAR